MPEAIRRAPVASRRPNSSALVIDETRERMRSPFESAGIQASNLLEAEFGVNAVSVFTTDNRVTLSYPNGLEEGPKNPVDVLTNTFEERGLSLVVAGVPSSTPDRKKVVQFVLSHS